MHREIQHCSRNPHIFSDWTKWTSSSQWKKMFTTLSLRSLFPSEKERNRHLHTDLISHSIQTHRQIQPQICSHMNHAVLHTGIVQLRFVHGKDIVLSSGNPQWKQCYHHLGTARQNNFTLSFWTHCFESWLDKPCSSWQWFTFVDIRLQSWSWTG